MQRLKKPLIVVAVFFALYAVLTSPNEAADIVHTSGGMLWTATQNVFGFFDAILEFVQALLS